MHEVIIDGIRYRPAAKAIDPQNFPKLQPPFVRDTTREGRGCLTPGIVPGYEWVFEDPDVIASEKLDGTGVSIVVQDGTITSVWNRTNPIPWSVMANSEFARGIRKAHEKGYFSLDQDRQIYGELMGPGPNIPSNFLNLPEPRWFPFEWIREHYTYRSFHEYPKTYDGWREWFRDGLTSLASPMFGAGKRPPEGIVFYRPSTGEMAKLRRDMWDWWHGKKHKAA